MKLEDMIKNEEQEKVDNQTFELMKKFQYEKRKKKCLDKLLKSRDKQDEKNRQQVEFENQIKNLREDAKNEVEEKRKKLKNKLLEIRRRAQRKNKLIEQKIQKVRGAMASDLMKANKKGDWRKCKEARKSKDKTNEYCNNNFSDSFIKNQECKDPENFCYVCCENEYGNMYLKKRDNCYNMCDSLAKKDLSNGEWVWNPKLVKV